YRVLVVRNSSPSRAPSDSRRAGAGEQEGPNKEDNRGAALDHQGGGPATRVHGSGDPQVGLPAPAAGREDRAASPAARGRPRGNNCQGSPSSGRRPEIEVSRSAEISDL